MNQFHLRDNLMDELDETPQQQEGQQEEEERRRRGEAGEERVNNRQALFEGAANEIERRRPGGQRGEGEEAFQNANENVNAPEEQQRRLRAAHMRLVRQAEQVQQAQQQQQQQQQQQAAT